VAGNQDVHGELQSPHPRGYRRHRLLVLIAFVVLSAAGGYVAGLSQGRLDSSSLEKVANAQLVKELEGLRSQFYQVRQKAVTLQRNQAIDEEALRQARYAMVELEGQVSDLQADLSFYRNIMAPSEASKGLQIESFSLAPVRGGTAYRFKIVLTQIGNNKRYISGQVAVNVIGVVGGRKEVIALRDLSEEIEDLGVRFRFRYFQDVEGVLSLPDGFEPLEVQIVAQGSNALQSERRFDWVQLAGG